MKKYQGVILWSDDPLNSLEHLKRSKDLKKRAIKRALFDLHTKVTIDWVDDEGDWGLVARSEDGFIFRGEYLNKEGDSGTVRMELVVLDSGEVVLMGHWVNNSQFEGGIAFRLHAAD